MRPLRIVNFQPETVGTYQAPELVFRQRSLGSFHMAPASATKFERTQEQNENIESGSRDSNTRPEFPPAPFSRSPSFSGRVQPFVQWVLHWTIESTWSWMAVTVPWDRRQFSSSGSYLAIGKALLEISVNHWVRQLCYGWSMQFNSSKLVTPFRQVS